MKEVLKKYFSKGQKRGERVFVAPNATLIGNVILEDDASIWYGAVLRADIAPLIIGKGSNVQDNCVLHIMTDVPVVLGEGVSIGHGAILHSCSIGNNVLVGMNATVLDKTVIGDNSIVAAGALVPPGKVYPAGSMIMGSPAKAVRELTNDEIDYIRINATHYLDVKAFYLENPERIK